MTKTCYCVGLASRTVPVQVQAVILVIVRCFNTGELGYALV